MRSCIFEKLFLWMIFCTATMPLAGQHRIAGQVRSAHDQLPLPAAHIRTADAGTVTDSLGRFSIETAETVLYISALGFHTTTYTLQDEESFLQIDLVVASEALPEVVVLAKAPVHPLQEPAAVQWIGEELLRRDRGLIITDVLNRVPGVFMQSGTFNTNRISIRGVGARSPFGTAKIRAYLDDIPLTNGVGETTLEDIDLSLLQSVEVWKGPSSSFYGAGLGGVLLLHPFSRNATAQTSFAEAQFQQGAYGTQRQVLRTVLSDPETPLQFQLNYNRLYSDGYRENNQLHRQSMSAIGKVQAGKGHGLTAIIQYTDARADIPSSINRKDFDQNPRKAAANWAAVKGFEDYDRLLAGVSHQVDWWRGAQGETVSSVVSLFTTIRNNYESRPFNILREQDQSMGVRTRMEYRRNPLRHLPNLLAGVEYFTERYDWTTNATRGGILDTLLSDNQELRRYANYFASWQADWGSRWSASAGVNLNTTLYSLTDYFTRDGADLSGRHPFVPLCSPRASIGYRLRPRASAFATISHGFAAPTLEETLAPQGTINRDIRPEKGWNVEAGSKGNQLNGRLSYAWSVYSMWIRDLLVSRRTSEDAYIGINAGKTWHRGLEAAIDYALLQGRWQMDVSLSAQLARFTFLEFVDDQGGDYSGNQLTGVPPSHLSGAVFLHAPVGVYTHLSYEFVDAFPLRDDNALFSDAYHLVHLKVGYQYTAKKWDLEGYIGVQNLTDTHYAAMVQVNASAFGTQLPRYYYPGMPRNAYAGFTLRRKIFDGSSR